MNKMNGMMVAGVLGMVLGMGGMAGATPSTTYWSPATTDIQPYRQVHLGIDDYFTVGRKAAKGGGDFPTDVGLTVGVLPFDKIQMEVGVDMLESSDDPLYFNAKIGTPEASMCAYSPAINVGIFNVGTKKNVTDQNVVYGLLGKTFPVLGRVFAGGYTGNGDVLVDAKGESDKSGFMVGMDHGFMTVKDAKGEEFSRWVIAADYMSGNNALGAWGGGVYYYFTKYISVLTGPVFFNEKAINGEWKWTTQLDVNIPF